MKEPDWELYLKASDKERLRLEAIKVWKLIDPNTRLPEGSQVLPITLVMSKKRDGTHKCRACILGNLQNVDDRTSVF